MAYRGHKSPSAAQGRISLVQALHRTAISSPTLSSPPIHKPCCKGHAGIAAVCRVVSTALSARDSVLLQDHLKGNLGNAWHKLEYPVAYLIYIRGCTGPWNDPRSEGCKSSLKPPLSITGWGKLHFEAAVLDPYLWIPQVLNLLSPSSIQLLSLYLAFQALSQGTDSKSGAHSWDVEPLGQCWPSPSVPSSVNRSNPELSSHRHSVSPSGDFMTFIARDPQTLQRNL